MGSQNSIDTGVHDILTASGKLIRSVENNVDAKFALLEEEINQKFASQNIKNDKGLLVNDNGDLIGGGMLQVVNKVIVTQALQTMGGGFFYIIDKNVFTASIIPRHKDSLIMIIVRWFGEIQGGHDVVFNITKNGNINRLGFNTTAGTGLSVATHSYSDSGANNSTTPEIMNLVTFDKVSNFEKNVYSLVLTSSNSSKRSIATNRCLDIFNPFPEYGVSEFTLIEVVGEQEIVNVFG